MVKKFSLTMIGVLLSSIGVFAQGHGKQQKLFPKPLNKLYLGMPMEEVAKKRPELKAEALKNDNFRYRWEEVFPEDSPIEAVGYYFDEEGARILYEMVIVYRDLSERSKWVRKKLGTPNDNDREWRLGSGEGFVIRAWLYKEKLIFAGVLPGTEWEKEEERN